MKLERERSGAIPVIEDEKNLEIRAVVEMVRAVADETNLLAMHASIEAARSEGNGQGFEIIAEQIRRLSDESMAAARQIIELVENGRAQGVTPSTFAEEISPGIRGALENVAALNRLAQKLGLSVKR